MISPSRLTLSPTRDGQRRATQQIPKVENFHGESCHGRISQFNKRRCGKGSQLAHYFVRSRSFLHLTSWTLYENVSNPSAVSSAFGNTHTTRSKIQCRC